MANNEYYIPVGKLVYGTDGEANDVSTSQGYPVNLVGSTYSGGGFPIPSNADYVVLVATSPTVDTYTYKTGGSSGTTVLTAIVTYTDSTKVTLANMEWNLA